MKKLILGIFFISSNALACIFGCFGETEERELKRIFFDYEVNQDTNDCRASFHTNDSPRHYLKLSESDQVYCNGQTMKLDENHSGYVYHRKFTVPPIDGKYVITFVRKGIAYESMVKEYGSTTLVTPSVDQKIGLQQDLKVQWIREPDIDTMVTVYILPYRTSDGKSDYLTAWNGGDWFNNAFTIEKSRLQTVKPEFDSFQLVMGLRHKGVMPKELRGFIAIDRTDTYYFVIQR